ncbi:MAG: HEPN domain-containing protein [Candidatus Andersenbacteria bacterium CG10_big_fil_rev_8_21_14_0_10_54_11]|uniref:HEPN domain-containing protein n=1 Tax=Candidatus Andersenbacteria bacterium CG10_big_fil_rev_8_21_14_0_10_54_11 TaxID=1974485 RepID=A0A2M6WZH3_9BACT|nr:MAG: HEPN domain-containing protein [Candidatus Andersenbacteria bacterium CG10_big_fil_rev_8_21_14_0_10_54_11]
MTEEEALHKRAPLELRKAREVLAEAAHLQAAGYNEGAISRAYYAVYHAARAVLYQHGTAPITHRGVMSEFSRLVIKTSLVEPEYHQILQTARNERLAADYETTERENFTTPDLAPSVIADAKRFIERMQKVLAE